MKFEDIQPGKAYTKVNVDRNKSNTKTRETITKVYVQEVNPVNRNIRASIGGAPSQWYPSNVWAHWKIQTKNPEV